MAEYEKNFLNDPPTQCMECEQAVNDGDAVKTENGVFCTTCYNRLLAQFETLVQDTGRHINYPVALMGALIGGALGVVAWWGFTYVTHYAFGLIAIVIGMAVAKGIDLSTGGKRSRGLQGIAISVTLLSYFYADYLVTRSFAIREDHLLADRLTLIPSMDIFYRVCSYNLDAMSLVFLGIALWQAYRMTQPLMPVTQARVA